MTTLAEAHITDSGQSQVAFDTAFAMLTIQLSTLAQSAAMRARLDPEQRETIAFCCEELARVLRQEDAV